VNPETHDTLLIARDENSKQAPFIVSDYREEDLVARKAGLGFILLNLGFNAFMLETLAYAGCRGGFNAVSYLLAALAPLGYLFLFMLGALYNDKVSRVERRYALGGFHAAHPGIGGRGGADAGRL